LKLGIPKLGIRVKLVRFIRVMQNLRGKQKKRKREEEEENTLD
jgi:hypothetical protein